MRHSIRPLIHLFIGVISWVSLGQQADVLEYNWESSPAYFSQSFPDQEIVGIKNHIQTEFVYDSEGNLNQYYLEHKIFWLNSDKKIEEYNKVYIPLDADSQIMVHKARVVSSKGKITELSENQFLSAQDEETQKNYKYFAFEGLEKGSFIEYFFVEKEDPSYNGTKINLQYSFPQNEVSFTLTSPRNLIFKTKGYNGLATSELDTLLPGKNRWKLDSQPVEGLENEEQSPYSALRKFIIYKLDANTYNNRKDISSYGNVAENLYNYFYKNVTDEEKAAVANFVKVQFPNGNEISPSALVQSVEDYIKTNIYFTTIRNSEHENLSSILDKKIANQRGLMKLFVQVLKQFDQPTEIVLTCNRFDLKFDPEFEAYNFLNEYLLYFPHLKQFTHPNNIDTRLGFPPAEYTETYGLFVKEVKVGSYASGVGEIKYIPSVSAENTYDNIQADITFNPDDISETYIHYKREMGGYSAAAFQPYLGLLTEERRKEIYDNIIFNSLSPNIEVTSQTVLGEEINTFGKQPFTIETKAKSGAFVDVAGNKYIFKLGELIGPQVEMYQDKNRQLPLEQDHQRTYYRTLTFTIPDGYKVENLEDINIYKSHSKDGKMLMYFKSSYQVEGNKVIVTADEQYNSNLIPLDLFEAYREVINSAADFNKVKLLLTQIQ